VIAAADGKVFYHCITALLSLHGRHLAVWRDKALTHDSRGHKEIYQSAETQKSEGKKS